MKSESLKVLRFKGTKSAILMHFAPGLMFANFGALTCFYQIKCETTQY